MTSEKDAGPRAKSRTVESAHAQHCFVVMPYGRSADEVRWFRGWYEVVIEPAVTSSGYDCILSAAEEQPGAINDEIRSHLAFDPMVVVDVGGAKPEDIPNPNVMYELGIRHAFGLPVVMMAWEHQELPFDVGNQRAVITGRHLLDLESTRQKLCAFIRSAAEGRYYNPMEAVGREATIEVASASLGEDSLLGALAKEVRELRSSLSTRPAPRSSRPKTRLVRSFIPKRSRKEFWPFAEELGLDAGNWGKLLSMPVPEDMVEEATSWGMEDWKRYMALRARDLAKLTKDTPTIVPQRPTQEQVTAEIIEAVAADLPAQPWPTGTHKAIAAKLLLTRKQVSRAINELIRQGRVLPQVDGQLYEPRGEGAKDSGSAARDEGSNTRLEADARKDARGSGASR